MSLSVTVICS